MLVTRSSLVEKLNSIREYCISRDAQKAVPQERKIKALFSPVYAAINAYFAYPVNISKPLSDVVEFMFYDLLRRTTVYEHDFAMGLPTDYPTGYSDVTLCLYQFSGLLNATAYSVWTSIVYEVPTDGSATTPVPVSSSVLSGWITEITAAPEAEAAALRALADWCDNSYGNSNLISLLEDQGRVVEHLEAQTIARLIYVDKKLQSIIAARGLSVYVPSYLR